MGFGVWFYVLVVVSVIVIDLKAFRDVLRVAVLKQGLFRQPLLSNSVLDIFGRLVHAFDSVTSSK